MKVNILKSGHYETERIYCIGYGHPWAIYRRSNSRDRYSFLVWPPYIRGMVEGFAELDDTARQVSLAAEAGLALSTGERG